MTLKGDWFWCLLADLLARLGVIVMLILYMAFLGQEATGVILVSLSYVMMCWLLVDLGLALYGARKVALVGANVLELQAEITCARLCLALFAAPLAFVLVVVMVQASVTLSLCFSAYLILRGLSLDWLFKGLGRFQELAYVNAVAAAAQIAVLPFVNQENWSQIGALPLLVWATVLTIFGWIKFGVSPLEVIKAMRWNSLRHVKKSFEYSLVNGMSTVFLQMPVVALSFVLAPAQIAGFGMLHRICMSSIILFTSLGASIYPRLVRSTKNSIASATSLAISVMFKIGVVAILPALGIAFVFAIPYVRLNYLPGLSWGVCFSLIAFMVLRSMRVAPMQLIFAANIQKRARAVSFVFLLIYCFVLVMLFVFDSLTTGSVSFTFAITELGILLFLARIAFSSNHHGDR